MTILMTVFAGIGFLVVVGLAVIFVLYLIERNGL